MTDLSRYMTDAVVDKSARAEWEYEWADRSWESTPDDFREFYVGVARASLSAVLPDIIKQAKAEVLRDVADDFATTLSGRRDVQGILRAQAALIEQGGQP